MEFEYSDSIYISERELIEIARQSQEPGYSVEVAVNDYANSLNGCDFYMFGHIEEQVVSYVYGIIERGEF